MDINALENIYKSIEYKFSDLRAFLIQDSHMQCKNSKPQKLQVNEGFRKEKVNYTRQPRPNKKGAGGHKTDCFLQPIEKVAYVRKPRYHCKCFQIWG